jgi:hypothetical protein
LYSELTARSAASGTMNRTTSAPSGTVGWATDMTRGAGPAVDRWPGNVATTRRPAVIAAIDGNSRRPARRRRSAGSGTTDER